MSAYSMNKRGWRLLVGVLFIATVVYLLRPAGRLGFSTDSLKYIGNSDEETVELKTNEETVQLNNFSEGDEEDMIITNNNNGSESQSEVSTEIKSEKMAFITFLCDDVMGEATQVLVHSLTQTRTKHDIVVLVLDDVTQTVRKRLEHLGAKIIDVNQVKYPWDSSNARRKGFNKACRYSKLNLWNLTQYKKVVFLDADTMVIQPIDELFDYPQFTAAVDIGGVLNTGVFVAEPNVDTYNDIMSTYETAPSYNRGDQGFLNYYFNQTAHPLPGNYNLMIKFTHFSTLAAGFVAKNTAKVLHFTSETKPWNFYFLHQREWHENYDGYLFGLWTRTLRQTREKLSKGGLWTDDYGAGSWSNSNRVKEICDNRLRKSYGRKYPKTKQFTVIINLNNASLDVDYFEQMLRHYASSKRVAQIYVNGNTFKDQNQKKVTLNSNYLKQLRLGKPISSVAKPFKTLNNNFNPIQGLQTDGVLLVDDNVLLSVRDIEYGYEVWKKNTDSAVGFFPDSHRTKNKGKQNTFVEGIDKIHYSMVQTGAMFIKSDFLYGYTCLVPEEIHHYVDQHPVCSDIAMNMLVSGQTGIAPVLVNPQKAYKFENKHPKTIQERSACIDGLSALFNGKNPLVYNNDIVSKVSSSKKQYQPIKPLSWSKWSESFDNMNI